jgi:hypothetical protein
MFRERGRSLRKEKGQLQNIADPWGAFAFQVRRTRITTNFNGDIVFRNGAFVQSPAGVQR